MAWCNECLVDHEGQCLAERRRQDVMGVLRGLLGSGSRMRPTSGVEEPFCPVRASAELAQAPASRYTKRRCPTRLG